MSGLSVSARGSQNEVFSFQNIYENAYLPCRKKKRKTFDALKYEINAEENTHKLELELENRTYCPSRSLLFVCHKPKQREIFAAAFRDRVIHHLLVNEYKRIYEPIFIYDSYACREGKGTHAAKERLEKFTRQITSNGHVHAYYLQLDIKDFFMSIDKELLFTIIQRKVKNPDILWLTHKVLFWDCTKSYVPKGDQQLLFNISPNKSLFGKDNQRGLPIGNLTSQYFANIYLNELDQYVKHEIKARYYLRYVDDFVLLSQNPSELRLWQAKVEEFLLSKLKLYLHPKRRKFLPISNGIDFLGYIIRPNYTLVRNRVINNLKEKVRQFKKAKIKNFEKFRDTFASYLGHFKHANAYHLTQKLMKEIYV
jgi:retron-type reverse transcriptase